MEKENLQKILEATRILAEEDTGESWKAVDALVEYTVQFAQKEEFIRYLHERLFDSDNGALRDLAATLVTKIDLSKHDKKYEDWLKINIIAIPNSERGIYDVHQYAQLRAVIAAVEHNWLTPELWKDLAKLVLEKNLEEMPDVVKPYLEKGKALYEK